MSYLNELNPAQREAVLHEKGPLLILAGAGAGKTRAIAYRILYLIKNGVAPEKILAVTFTNKASKEMRERVMQLLREDKELNLPLSFESAPFVKTFHSLGVHILRENFRELNIPKYFSILDKDDSRKIVKEIIVSLDLNPKQIEPRKILGIISRQKGNLATVSAYAEKIRNDYFSKITAEVWQKYEEVLAKEKAFDFDDLLLKTAFLLSKNKEVLGRYQNRWQYIHIDEYQDTNRTQYKIAKLLSQKHQNICVVGDEDQLIYGWRGANIENILHFEKDFPNSKTVLLEENYRSTQNILAVANGIISKNNLRKDKNLFTKNREGERVGVYTAYDESDEANFVAQKCDNLIKDAETTHTSDSGKIKTQEIAVLYRTNFQSRVLEEAFLNAGVPYQVLGTKFFERKEIKDVLAFIKTAINPDDLTSLKRIINIPPRGIGKVTLAKIFAGKENELSPAVQEKIAGFRELLGKIKNIAEEKTPSELVKFVIKKTGLKEKLKNGTEDDLERLANMKELASVAVKYNQLPKLEGVEKLLEEASLASDQDQLEEKTKAVRLMTVHASKGLEFDYVFITGLEDRLFPGKLDNKISREREEEERRLFYVALTRAKEKIFLSYAAQRTIFGSRRTNVVSEFITDINEGLLENENANFAQDFSPAPAGKIEYLEW